MDLTDRNIISSRAFRDSTERAFLDTIAQAQDPLLLSSLEVFDHKSLFQSMLFDRSKKAGCISQIPESLGKIRENYFLPKTYLKKLSRQMLDEFLEFQFLGISGRECSFCY